jgi:hypothetical protein
MLDLSQVVTAARLLPWISEERKAYFEEMQAKKAERRAEQEAKKEKLKVRQAGNASGHALDDIMCVRAEGLQRTVARGWLALRLRWRAGSGL